MAEVAAVVMSRLMYHRMRRGRLGMMHMLGEVEEAEGINGRPRQGLGDGKGCRAGHGVTGRSGWLGGCRVVSKRCLGHWIGVGIISFTNWLFSLITIVHVRH
jgi:hypothetical protein